MGHRQRRNSSRRALRAGAGLSLCLCVAAGCPAHMRYTGFYVDPHDVTDLSFGSAEGCAGAGGRWRDGFCVQPGRDVISMFKAGSAPWAQIETVSTNWHTCDVVGALEAVDGGFVLRAPSEVYVGVDQPTVPATCVVDLWWDDSGRALSATPREAEACAMFCGARGALDVDGARWVGRRMDGVRPGEREP